MGQFTSRHIGVYQKPIIRDRLPDAFVALMRSIWSTNNLLINSAFPQPLMYERPCLACGLVGGGATQGVFLGLRLVRFFDVLSAYDLDLSNN